MKYLFFLLTLSLPGLAANQMFDSAFYQMKTSANSGAVLDLDFANQQYLLNGSVYNSFSSFMSAIGGSFSRASTATYTNNLGLIVTASNNEPRFDYDPVTHEAKGILVEETRTNYSLSSEQVVAPYWSTSGGVTVQLDQAVAPDGSLTADKLTTTGTALSFFKPADLPNHGAGDYVTLSIYAKADTGSKIFFELYRNATTSTLYGVAAAFDLSSRTVTTNLNTTAYMQEIGNGWFRLVATRLFEKARADDRWGAIFIDTYGTEPAGKSINLWGVQSEIGPNVTSYIPTATIAVTRAADQFSIPTASWFDATKGTFFANSYGQLNNNQKCCGRIIGGDYPKSFVGFKSGSLAGIQSWNNSTTVTAPDSSFPASLFTPIKGGFTWNAEDSSGTVGSSGGKINNQTYSGNWSSINIYPGGSNYNPLNAPLRRIMYYPQRLSDLAIKNLVQ